jgi:uncharacterized protein
VIDSTSQKDSPAVGIFARLPALGKGKSRLWPLLGREGAVAFQAALMSDAVRKVVSLGGIARYLFILANGPLGFAFSRRDQARNYQYTVVVQQGTDLGERLEGAFRRLLRRHWRALVIGTDSPELSRRGLRQALNELRWCDAVLGPCPDGGYYLIGLRRLEKDLLRGVRWGTSFAFQDTLHNLLKSHFSCSVLEPLLDIDRPADFRRLSKSLSLRPQLRRLAPATSSFVNRRESAQDAIPGSRAQSRRRAETRRKPNCP